jgi:hypothetical protein
MNRKSFFVIVIVAITIAVITFLILRLLDMSDNTAIVGGIVGAVVGALIGTRLKPS